MSLLRMKSVNHANHKFDYRALLFAALSLAGIVMLPTVQGVSPAPDGGYPGGNTAEGQNSLLSLTTGTYNTAIGIYSLLSLTDGSFCTGLGAGSLLVNTASENTATGAGALLSNTTGGNNTANGVFALFNNTTGGGNTANGVTALANNITGSSNAANGASALYNNITGGGNTANGAAALYNNTSGNNNIGLGVNVGSNVGTASNVICIGSNVAGSNVSNRCFIGNIRGATTANADAIPVLIDSAGQLGTMSSSRRFKKEIEPMNSASEAILALKPVTFHYKTDKTRKQQFGLIAEEVAQVNPDLVVRDENGDFYTVRYDAVNAMLLNEFLKEHRKNQQQESTIAELKSTVEKQKAINAQQQKRIEMLAAGLQKVSAQLEASTPAMQTVVDDQPGGRRR